MNLKRLSLSILLLLVAVSSLLAQEEAQWYPIPLDGGLSEAATDDNLAYNMALQMNNFVLQGNALEQIRGADKDHASTLKTSTPVRKLYRYYNEDTDTIQTIAVCGNLIYYCYDQTSTYVQVGAGDGTDSIIYTNGDSLIYGFNTDWVPMKGEHDGDGWSILLGTKTYTIQQIYNDTLLELTDTVVLAGAASDTIPATISIPARNNYVDFEIFNDKLFISNGTDPVFRWNGTNIDNSYYMVDSAVCDSITLNASEEIRFHLPLLGDSAINAKSASLQRYVDSNYAIIVTGIGNSIPQTIVSTDTTPNGDCKAIKITNINASLIDTIPQTAKIYVVLPLAPKGTADDLNTWGVYGISYDTVYSGTIDSSYQDTVPNYGTSTNLRRFTIWDHDNDWELREFSSGAYILKIITLDTLTTLGSEDFQYFLDGRNIIADTINDTVVLRAYAQNAGGGAVNDKALGNSEYQILRIYYYPRAKYVESHQNRMWFGNVPNGDDALYYSSVGDPDNLHKDESSLFNRFDIDIGDGEEITQLSSMYGELYIYKDNSIWVIFGYALYEYTLREAFAGASCISPYSLVRYGVDYFCGYDGMYYFDGSEPKYMCEPVRDMFRDSCNAVYKHKITAGIFDGHLWIGYPAGNDTNITAGLVYDFVQTWSTADSLFGGDYVSKRNKGENDSTLIGGRAGFVWQYGSSPQYDSNQVVAKWKSAWLDFNTPEGYMQFERLLIGYSKSDTAQIIVRVFTDGKSDTLFTDSIKAGDGNSTALHNQKMFELPLSIEGNRFSVMLETAQADSAIINKVKVYARRLRDEY